MTKRIALVTGANRGIGLEVVKQLASKGLHVILTARNQQKGSECLADLIGEGFDVSFLAVDVTDEHAVKRLAGEVKKNFGSLDVLVNNAAIMTDTYSGLEADLDNVKTIMETNFYGAWRMVKAFTPLMKDASKPRIINVSSEMGSLTDMRGGHPGYRMSKTALNGLTAMLASELSDTAIKINSVHPGWVKTEMGGSKAPRNVKEGADSITWLATADQVPHGKFICDRQVIPW
jgi:NAD(P)-dependent dehydrogenase (short-subunit alcohol dehydrogenase family)